MYIISNTNFVLTGQSHTLLWCFTLIPVYAKWKLKIVPLRFKSLVRKKHNVPWFCLFWLLCWFVLANTFGLDVAEDIRKLTFPELIPTGGFPIEGPFPVALGLATFNPALKKVTGVELLSNASLRLPGGPEMLLWRPVLLRFACWRLPHGNSALEPAFKKSLPWLPSSSSLFASGVVEEATTISSTAWRLLNKSPL